MCSLIACVLAPNRLSMKLRTFIAVALPDDIRTRALAARPPARGRRSPT